MASDKPFCIVSQMYDWENDNSVFECLVFMDPGIDTEIEKPELKATYKLRAVKNSDGMFSPLIRNGGGKAFIIHEFSIKYATHYYAMRHLIHWLENCFEIRNHKFKNVPDKKVD